MFFHSSIFPLWTGCCSTSVMRRICRFVFSPGRISMRGKSLFANARLNCFTEPKIASWKKALGREIVKKVHVNRFSTQRFTFVQECLSKANYSTFKIYIISVLRAHPAIKTHHFCTAHASSTTWKWCADIQYYNLSWEFINTMLLNNLKYCELF